MAKLRKLYILNMRDFMYVSYIWIKQFKKNLPVFQHCHNPTNAVFILNEKIGSIVWSSKDDLISSINFCNCKIIQLHVHICLTYCLLLAFPHIPVLPIWRHMCFSQWWHLFLFTFAFFISTLSPSCKKTVVCKKFQAKRWD